MLAAVRHRVPAMMMKKAPHFLIALRQSSSSISYLREIDGVPKPGAFSRATTHGGLVYVSGTGASSNDTGSVETTPMTAAEETCGALENISKILKAANSSVDRIVNATMLISDPKDYAECNEAYVAFLKEHGCVELPSRATALWGVPTNAKVAFSCVAAVADQTDNKRDDHEHAPGEGGGWTRERLCP